MIEPAIGILEFSSIARGHLVLDAIIKKAPIRVLESRTTTGGKFIIMFCGEVASVEESFAEGLLLSQQGLSDSLLLAHVHRQIVPILDGAECPEPEESFGIVETSSIPAAVLAADKALKAAAVHLMELRFLTGLSGKSFLTLTGPLDQLEAALDAAVEAIRDDVLVGCEVVQQPDPESWTWYHGQGSGDRTQKLRGER